MRSWYSIEAKAKADAPTEAEIFVYDAIGKAWSEDEAVSARQFIADLAALPESVKTIHVRVNSPGGDVFEALAIANALRAESQEKGRTVRVSIEGLAASAATVVTAAGKPVSIAENALFMVHEPWSIAIGNSADMRETADALDRARDSIVTTYRWNSPLSETKLRELMAASTWMDAEEAVANGFASEVVEGLRAAATISRPAAAGLDVPEKFQPRIAALLREKPAPPEPTPAPAPPPAPPVPAGPKAASTDEVLSICAAANLLDLAPELAKAGKPLADVEAAVKAEAAKRKAEAARVKHIRQFCAATFAEARVRDGVADVLVKGGMDARETGRLMVQISALLDSAEIDSALLPEGSGAPLRGPRISTAEVYRNRNKTHDEQRGLTTG